MTTRMSRCQWMWKCRAATRPEVRARGVGADAVKATHEGAHGWGYDAIRSDPRYSALPLVAAPLLASLPGLPVPSACLMPSTMPCRTRHADRMPASTIGGRK